MSELSAFLAASEWIDVQHPLVQAQAKALAKAASEHAVAQACFEFVRDEIAHSVDGGHGRITCRASDVLRRFATKG